MEGLALSFGVATAGALLYALIKLLQIGRRPAGYPPGPPTVPILGNLHLMPAKYGHRQLRAWAQNYGPIYSLMLETKTYIVLSSGTAVRDLLDKRSNIYSSRPDMYMAHDVASGGLRILTMKYGPLWRTIHKMIHNILNIRAAITYVPYQDLENKLLLLGFNSLTTQMVFGFRTPSFHDPKLQQLFEGFEKWGQIVGSASAQLLDLYPLLRYLPKFLARNYQYAENSTKRRKTLLSAKPCFCNDLLRAQANEKFSDGQAGYVTGSLLEAGSDTTSSVLIGFVQAMVMFPDAQKKAQEEIDRVVGPDRLPTMDDEPRLQYVRGCVKESLRWMPTAILGAAHSVIKDDSYMGYKIPAEASIILNVWAIHMDPDRYPNPRTEFESATNPDVSKRGNFVFGAGRRICQGMHIAERSLFLAISRMLWAFNFSKPLDANGQPIIPDIEDLVVIICRDETKAEIIRREWAECEESLLDRNTKQWKKVPEGMAFSTDVPEKIEV
ncbi:cytochrome P450 [Glonium stellatum]|uniref:Cytochrome P450 n=1 Tax=Glonium stellatum TaxID=574774 RepID=A0A8E2F5B8_9PEZI|nr:cytochrome P450 [Glonium stellatum]